MTNSITSITDSQGQSLKIEATALSVIAWSNNVKFNDYAKKGIDFIIE